MCPPPVAVNYFVTCSFEALSQPVNGSFRLPSLWMRWIHAGQDGETSAGMDLISILVVVEVISGQLDVFLPNEDGDMYMWNPVSRHIQRIEWLLNGLILTKGRSLAAKELIEVCDIQWRLFIGYCQPIPWLTLACLAR